MATAFNDSAQVEASRSNARLAKPHEIEVEVNRRLQQIPQINIKSLVVRRIPNGVCVEGRIEVGEDQVDLSDWMRDIPGLDEFVNHLVISHVKPTET